MGDFDVYLVDKILKNVLSPTLRQARKGYPPFPTANARFLSGVRVFARGIVAEPLASEAKQVMERIARRERAEGARSGSPYFKLRIKN
jgi:hypothetical protein